MKPRTITLLLPGIAIAMAALLATPALAYWQFFERPPGIGAHRRDMARKRNAKPPQDRRNEDEKSLSRPLSASW
jgi:hypothetical protein